MYQYSNKKMLRLVFVVSMVLGLALITCMSILFVSEFSSYEAKLIPNNYIKVNDLSAKITVQESLTDITDKIEVSEKATYDIYNEAQCTSEFNTESAINCCMTLYIKVVGYDNHFNIYELKIHIIKNRLANT